VFKVPLIRIFIKSFKVISHKVHKAYRIDWHVVLVLPTPVRLCVHFTHRQWSVPIGDLSVTGSLAKPGLGDG
jgi:hypothetical protein